LRSERGNALIQDFSEFFRKNNGAGRPWLITGPSVPPRKRPAAVKEGFAVLTIGDVAARFECDLALVVDIETVQANEAAILANAEAVVMPREPHEDGWPRGKNLETYADESPALRQLAGEDRLFAFDLWTGNRASSDLVVSGDYHGEEVPLRLLAAGGIKLARHLGTRGQKSTSTGFEAVLQVGQRTGGDRLAELCRASGISYGPYGFPMPARIFVEAADEEAVPFRVLKSSLERSSTMDVLVERLDRRPDVPPFLARFDIPRCCGYTGLAIHLLADALVLADITELWTLSFEGAHVLNALVGGASSPSGVTLLNCEALRWDVEEIARSLGGKPRPAAELLGDRRIVRPGRCKALIPSWWESVDALDAGRTALIRYADKGRQPWLSYTHPDRDPWYAACAAALDDRSFELSELEDAVQRSDVSPEIFDWIGRPSNRDLSRQTASWVPPGRRLLHAITSSAEPAKTNPDALQIGL